MKESFSTLPINTNAGDLILSSPYDPPSDVISTISTYNVIIETYDDIYTDLKTKNNKEPELEDWQEIAAEIKQEVKMEYLFNGQHGFLQKAIDYAVKIGDKELEADLRRVTPPKPEFISNFNQNDAIQSKDKLQSEKKRKKKNKDQRKARRANRKRK